MKFKILPYKCNSDLRFITSNTLVPCVLFSKFDKAPKARDSHGSVDGLRVTLGWGLPNKRVSHDLDLQLILWSDEGKSVCLVHPKESSKIIFVVVVIFIKFKKNRGRPLTFIEIS